MTGAELGRLAALAREVALAAGARLEGFRRRLGGLAVSHKKAQGVVSEADVAVERFIVRALGRTGAGAGVLAEEDAWARFRGAPPASFRDMGLAWAVDPLDGTSNFLNGLDYHCVSIALLARGRPLLGVVHRPPTGEVFSAVRGRGAWKEAPGRRRRRLRAGTNPKALRDALLVTGFSSEKGDRFDKEIDVLKNLVGRARGIRRMGSAALDLCYVAEGVFDCFWERGLAPWDVAAGGLVCLEAGARVTDLAGGAFDPFGGSIVAGREPLRGRVLRRIRRVR